MTASLTQGLLITFEGGEGSGKSTLLQHLYDVLTAQGYEVVKTREPGGSQLGEKIRQLLLNQDQSVTISHKAELLLFLAARAQHIDELIRPAIKAGKIVLCDRFNDSTIAYQGAARGLEMDSVERLCELVCEDVQPHLTIFLEVDPQVGLLRTQQLSKEHAESGQFDRIESEKLDFHERVRQAFHQLASKHPERIKVLDANQAQDSVQQQAQELMNRFISSFV